MWCAQGGDSAKPAACLSAPQYHLLLRSHSCYPSLQLPPLPPPATKLLWLKRREPENWARLARVLLPHDYINYWLSGRVCAEASDASGTGLLDPTTRRWDAARVAALDGGIGGRLAGCLPPLVGPDEVVGTVRPALAAQLGLVNPAGVVVAPGGGDNAMAALGSGAVQEGSWVLSLGTSGECCCWGGEGGAGGGGVGGPRGDHLPRAVNLAMLSRVGGAAPLPARLPACLHPLPHLAPSRCGAGTLFGPSARPVLDPSGAICPFCSAANDWLPLLCTLNCTAVTEEASAVAVAPDMWEGCLAVWC